MKGVIMGSMDEAIKKTVQDKDFKIQPVEFITSNNLTFLEGNVIKYTTRARYKNGIEDYEKAKHCLELLIEHIKEHGHNE
jgi:hypothetical protein